uniref:PAZ domain-containing protein n=1 Tax=Eptatretus burgeri TaxID=7764 RepID=A0A8C4WR65_EPTBU
MRILQMKLVGKSYFDPLHPVMIPCHRQDLYHQKGHEGFRDECMRQLVGAMVITRYNNRTYRIDDIAWDKTPRSTFLYREASTSFADYYK